jgi:PAS domain S-box-containing protein
MKTMGQDDKVNILLVDDQPAKLLSYEVILRELGENLIVASSGREALEYLLKNDVAVVLLDVCMPELDGFELAAMIRDHPRFQKTAMIFISAIQVTDIDHLRGYAMGAVDYVPVPVIPEVLRAKVKVFAELYRKTRELERLNTELEERVRARTAELEASTARLLESEQRRSLAIAAGNMGSWDWDWITGDWIWDEGQYRIFGVDPATFVVTPDNVRALLMPEDVEGLTKVVEHFSNGANTYETEFRIRRPSGEIRWCIGTAAASVDGNDQVIRVSGVTIDITERKRAEQRQNLLSREVDHRGKNALALVQSIVRLTRADSIRDYSKAVEGRITALARVHTILSLSSWEGAELSGLIGEELAPFATRESRVTVTGPKIQLTPATAQTLALALHELATNAAKYGALSALDGRVTVDWKLMHDTLELEWTENAGPRVQKPASRGFGTRSVIASIETQLGGRASFDWRPEGLLCQLTVPLTEQPALQDEAAIAEPAHSNGETTVFIADRRVHGRVGG